MFRRPLLDYSEYIKQYQRVQKSHQGNKGSKVVNKAYHQNLVPACADGREPFNEVIFLENNPNVVFERLCQNKNDSYT